MSLSIASALEERVDAGAASGAVAACNADRLAALRELLSQKFPVCDLKPAGVLPTGLQTFDQAEGGLLRGAVTELVGRTSAGALFVETMLGALEREKTFGALIDAGSAFDPQGCESPALQRLLWIRCSKATEAVKAADLLLRDGNLPLIVLDLVPLRLREIGRVPASTWHRFQRLVEPTGTALVILTPRPLVEGARVRIAVHNRWNLGAMRHRRRDLLGKLQAQVFTRRQFSALDRPRQTA